MPNIPCAARRAAVAALLALVATQAFAATPIGTELSGGAGWRDSAFTLVPTGRCGSGGVVRGDGCRAIAADGLGFGQDMPGGLNSQDGDAFTFTVAAPDGFSHLWISARDAADQARSSWVLDLEGATAELLGRQRNGSHFGWLFQLDQLVTSISGSIRTRLNDGFSLRAEVCSGQGR